MRRRVLDRLVWLLMLAMVLMGVTACTTTGGSLCAVDKPIRLSQHSIDALSDSEVAAILANNERLQKLCGVRP